MKPHLRLEWPQSQSAGQARARDLRQGGRLRSSTLSKMFDGPIIELHISNIHKREAYYHHSYVSKVATAIIAGFGPEGYRVATSSIKKLLEQPTNR